MSKPEIETRAFGYILTWAEEQIQAKVGLIRLHTAGNVTAEVEFSTTNEQWDSGFLHRSHLNLSSTQSMKSTAKFLTSRYDKELLSEEAWGAIIEQLCYQTINLTRIGEEAHEVFAVGDPEPPPAYIVDPVIQEGQANLLFGEKQAGKTQSAMLICAICGLPWYDNPFQFGVPDKQIVSLWLDWETDRSSFAYLYNQLQLGMGVLLPAIHYRHCRSSLPNDIEQIAHWKEKTKAELVVVDHIGLAAGGPLNDDVTATTYFNAVRQLKTTTLHLAHQSKNPETKRKTTFGSAFWENIPRTVWELKKLAEAEDSLDTVMTLTKRNIGKKVPPFGLRYTYNGVGTKVERFEPNDVAEYVQETSASNRIFLYLQKNGAATSTVILNELGIPKDTVYKTLKRMMDRAILVKVGQNYGLVSNRA